MNPCFSSYFRFKLSSINYMEIFTWRRWPLAILSFKIPQVIIVLWSGGLTDKISWLQYLVIAKSLFMASKGPAMEYLEAKSRRQATLDKEGCPYLQQTLAKKLQQLGKKRPYSMAHMYFSIEYMTIQYTSFSKADAVLLFPDHLSSSVPQPRHRFSSIHLHNSLPTVRTGNHHSRLHQSCEGRGLSCARAQVYSHNR